VARKKKLKTEFHSKFPTSYEDHKAGEEVVYKRMSDGSLSIGVIKYFHVNCEDPAVVLVDMLLGNFQTAFVRDIKIEMSEKKKRALWVKAENSKGRRRARK
tara:strand:- start:33 stop:335 length:303 start_codon:yes stop_codon:yes gene_type:complete